MWRDYMGEGDRRSFAYQIQSARCETRRVRSKTVVRPKADYVRRSAAKLGYLDQAGFAEDMPRLIAGDYQSPDTPRLQRPKRRGALRSRFRRLLKIAVALIPKPQW